MALNGGKADLASKIIALMPARCKNPNKPDPTDPGWVHYVEPYFGGGSVLLANDPTGISEVVNDRNKWLTNFWHVLGGDEEAFGYFLRMVESTPFSEVAFDEAATTYSEHPSLPEVDPVTAAWAFFVFCRQSLAGRMKGFTGITKTRARRGMNNEVSAWLTAVDGLPAIHERLKRVLILNRDALEVIKGQDGPRTLFYLDPPYLHETRATTKEYGEHEMTAADHGDLLDAVVNCQGKVMLSGYPSKLYDCHLMENLTGRKWTCHTFDMPNNAAGGKTKRRMVEVVWTNF